MTRIEDAPLELRALAPGDVAALLAAYGAAVSLSDELRTELAGCGVAGDVVAVVPSLDAAGEPVVRVALSGSAAARLVEVLAGGPPRHGVPTHPPSDRAA